MAKAIEWSDLEVIRILGEGQAGKVWLARLKHPFEGLPSGSYVAVKLYKSWLLDEPGQFERIVRELEIGRRVKHSNLVRTLSIIRDSNGNPALVMNYYEGETLEEYLEKLRAEDKYVDVELAFQIVGNLASALTALHKANVIHRDIKPANVILSSTGPILMDLGVIASSDFPECTTTGKFLGTIRYAAPEYLFGEKIDSRIDLYSFGAVVYEIFIGKRFLYFTNQWAKLIARKYEYINSSLVNTSWEYPTLEQRFTLNVAEFIKFIFDRTLVNHNARTLDLHHLADVISQRLWEKPFYLSQDKIVSGEPMVRYLGVWEENAPVANLQDVVNDLRGRLSDEERKCLRVLLQDYFWKDTSALAPILPPIYSVNVDLDRSIESLKKKGAIRYSGSNIHSKGFKTHEAIQTAYRYGYL